MEHTTVRRHHFTHKDVNAGQKSFAAGLNVYSLIWVFFVGSFIGVVSETLLHLLEDGQWVRTAGMLYGPFNQVYGLGAVMFTLLLYRFRDRSGLLIFLVGMAAGMVFEFGVSWVQQLLFGSTSWDYSSMASSIGGGRTNFKYGVGWGLMGLLFITRFWPWMSEMVQRIPNRIGRPLTIVIAVLLCLDMALSAAAVWRANERHRDIPATSGVERLLDQAFPDDVMARKYPSMKFV